MSYQNPDPRKRRVEDPPMRPTPSVADREGKAWIPGKNRRKIPVATIVRNSSIIIFSLAALAGLFWVVSNVFQTYLG